MQTDSIYIKGARAHNLKNISLKIPRNKLVVITGLSGSGKSSLAFDTIYAEGQRRYVESLSAYARQFLELMEKPDVDLIEGLSPAISIEQRSPSHNPRSTVGTVTEIYDYLRLLYARIGKPHCPDCGREIKTQSAQAVINDILKFPQGTKLQVYSPIIRGRKGEFKDLFGNIRKKGFLKVRVDGKLAELSEKIILAKYKNHTIEILIDRLTVSDKERERIADAVELALRESGGHVLVEVIYEKEKKVEPHLYSEHFSCAHCGVSLPDLEPRLFSFNSPFGACPECDGLGNKVEVDEDLIVPNKGLSIRHGALVPWSNPITTRTHRWKGAWSGWYAELLDEVSKDHKINLDKPFNQLSREERDIIFYGDGNFEGVITNMKRRYKETESEYVRNEIYNTYMRKHLCPACKGGRLRKEARHVLIKDKSIIDLTNQSINHILEFFEGLKLGSLEHKIAFQILKEIKSRVKFLINVGLDYLTLHRETMTLSGGEAQRIHLATQIGSGLVGVLYVLDEPTIGLHERDNKKLLDTLIHLRDLGNTLIVVEHDRSTIESADHIIDLGPGAGIHGGSIIASGSPKEVIENPSSLTGQYLKGELTIPIPEKRRKPNGKYLVIKGAAQFNLKNIDVEFPLGSFICVSGVSGSGKSTLIHEILYKGVANKLYGSKELPGKHKSIIGLQHIDKMVIVDQTPIGRTPRSNPATYTGVYSPIRDLFAQLPEAKRRGYKPGRFSFNVKGGRCENCQGDGIIKIEMQFLPDVYVRCEVCQGKRFNDETLNARYKGKNIAEVLDMTVETALDFFKNIPRVKHILQMINDVGLGYIALGQSATTLSGGEAQRVKLASELCRRATGKTVYILDEPTTGLHFADVGKLLAVLQKLVDMGNTVIVIEHNMEVLKIADWIVDLGPGGGEAGGNLVAEGSPEEIIKSKSSFTAKFLKDYLVK
ncbi:MAG: excinuclease ABC subunit UvrA [bacterium]